MDIAILSEDQIVDIRERALFTIKAHCLVWLSMVLLIIVCLHWHGWQYLLLAEGLPEKHNSLTIAFTSFALSSLAFVIGGVGLLLSLAFAEKRKDLVLRFHGKEYGLLGIHEMTKPLSDAELVRFNAIAKEESLAKDIVALSIKANRKVRKFEFSAVLEK